MLAVQQAPRMGSSQTDADGFQPFGYAVDPTRQDALFDIPDPAGARLLSETDSKFLDSFFQDMTSDQYNMPSFGEGLNFSETWLQMPPQFMGTTTSFGPQSGQQPLSVDPQAFLNEHIDFASTIAGSQLMPPPPAPAPAPTLSQQLASTTIAPQQPQTISPMQSYQRHSDDVINAAATLLQNGSNPRSGSRGSKGENLARRPRGPPIGHLRHQGMEEFQQESRKDSIEDVHDNTFTQWMFGGKEATTPTSPRKPQLPDLQWGSDASFATSHQTYVPAPNKENVESHHKAQMQCLDCLEPSKSAANTRPSSPGPSYMVKSEDTDAPPRKRRKSKNQKDVNMDEDDDDDDDTDSRTSNGRKKKGSKNIDSMPSPPDSNGKRRKSAAAKATRENLSEEQKRENHIRSEQKRRTVIKEGFDDLCELVPGLRGGGFSKSTMLTMAGEWLEQLLEGNKALSQQLGRS